MNLQSLSKVRDILDVFDERFYDLKEALLSQKGDTIDLERKYRYSSTEVIMALNESIAERKIEEDQIKKEAYMKRLFEIICKCADVDPSELLMSRHSRERKFVLPRQMHTSFLHKTFGISLAKSASNYSQDHATCSYAYKNIRNLYQTDKNFRDQFDPVIKHCIDYDKSVKKNRTIDYLNEKT